jgi:lactoylglutathione lyase
MEKKDRISAKFNHYSIAVTNLEVSVYFYSDIVGLKQKQRPDFSFRGAWFDLGNGLELHLIEQTVDAIQISGTRSLHFAFAVDDLISFKTFLIQNDVEVISDIKKRPDGPMQLFVTDPDGYFVEFTQLIPL